MHIMMLCNQYVNKGKNIGNQFVHAQAKALYSRGCNVSVLSIDTRSIRKKRRLGIYWDKVDGIPVCVVSIPCGPIPKVLDMCISIGLKIGIKNLNKFLGKPDIIHAHFQYAAYLNFVKKKYNVPIVTTEHASWILNSKRTAMHENKALKAYNNSDKVLCVSPNLYDSIKDFYNEQIEIVPNVVSKQFRVTKTKKTDKFTFISVGHLRKHKNHYNTIRAFAKFNKVYPNTRLEIIGIGDQEQELRELIHRLSMGNNIFLLGYIDNAKLVQYYNHSHCFCLPSLYETFGVVYIEAMASGIPVIANMTALENGIIDSSNGLTIDTDIQSIYSAMCSIYNDYSKYEPEKISKRCIDKYGENAISEKLITVYNSLILNISREKL